MAKKTKQEEITKELSPIEEKEYELAVLQDDARRHKTPWEVVASKILDNIGGDLETVLSEVYSIALEAETSDPKWFYIPDHKTRLRALKLLLEVRWDLVNKTGKINVNVWFNQLITRNGWWQTKKPDLTEIVIPRDEEDK